MPSFSDIPSDSKCLNLLSENCSEYYVHFNSSLFRFNFRCLFEYATKKTGQNQKLPATSGDLKSSGGLAHLCALIIGIRIIQQLLNRLDPAEHPANNENCYNSSAGSFKTNHSAQITTERSSIGRNLCGCQAACSSRDRTNCQPIYLSTE